jgi:hypothetical protein
MNANGDVKQLVDPVLEVWAAIGHDILAALEAVGDEPDNESAIEMCLDADHLTLTVKLPEADRLLKQLCSEYGFTCVVQALAREVSLV